MGLKFVIEQHFYSILERISIPRQDLRRDCLTCCNIRREKRVLVQYRFKLYFLTGLQTLKANLPMHVFIHLLR